MIYALLGIAAAFCAFIQWGDEIPLPHTDANKKEAKYVLNVKKADEKDKYEKQVYNKKILHDQPSGYMTVEEYELASAPKDRMTMEVDVPKVPTPSDMLYVPQPSYQIVKYNNPPGSFEISLGKSFYQKRQQNAQGIVSPDFTKLVYPSVYYYPNSASTACDLFVINLNEAKSNKDKILTANVLHRVSDPILSTEKSNDNYYTFRTLTPVDFNPDGTRLLVKEKIGNTKDGIWKTTPIVYDFTNNLSYNLIEVRGAITYYWETYKSLDLDDKRWDIYPLGFDAENPDWVVVNAVAYTGSTPVDLGIWKVTYTGEQSRLVSFNKTEIKVSMNGYKLVKSGVEPPSVLEYEGEKLKQIEKEQAKQKEKEEKKELKELKKSYKTKLKELDSEYNESQKDYNLRQKINGSTSENETVEKYKEIKEQQEEKRLQQLEKQKEKELKELEKQKLKEQKMLEKQENKKTPVDENTEQ